MPEPKGRTFGELDILFERKTPARDFKHAVVDQFAKEEPSSTDEERSEEKADGKGEYHEHIDKL